MDDANYHRREQPNTASTSCSACKYQRKGCKKDECKLREHFPPSKEQEFSQVQRVFGVSNMSKMITGHDKKSPGPERSLEEQRQVVESLCWEGKAWEDDPVRGPYGIYQDLIQQRNQLVQLLQHYQQSMQQMQMPVVHNLGTGNSSRYLPLPGNPRRVELLGSQPRVLQTSNHNQVDQRVMDNGSNQFDQRVMDNGSNQLVNNPIVMNNVIIQRVTDNGSSNVNQQFDENWLLRQPERNGHIYMNQPGNFVPAGAYDQHVPDLIKRDGSVVAPAAGNQESGSRMNDLHNNAGQGYHHRL